MQTIKKLFLAAILCSAAFFSQAQNLSMQVIDENKDPLAGAAVYAKIQGVFQRNVTNLEGKCDISPTSDSVVIAFGGYKTLLIATELLKKNPVVRLELSNKSLSIKKMNNNKPVAAVSPKLDSTALKAGAYSITYYDETEKAVEVAVSAPSAGKTKAAAPAVTEIPTIMRDEVAAAGVAESKRGDYDAPPPPSVHAPASMATMSAEPPRPVSMAPTRAASGKLLTARAASGAVTSAKHDVKMADAASMKSSPVAKGKKAMATAKPIAEKEEGDKIMKDVVAKGVVAEVKKPAAHQLTAGEVNDFTKWTLWKDIALTQLEEHRKAWQIMPMQRYMVQLQTENGLPIVDASVELMENEKAVWAAKSDNTGKAEMWLDAFERNVAERSDLSLKVTYKNKTYNFSTVKRFQKGINIFKLPVKCDMPTKIDVAFIVDATGSMGDEIAYLKSELTDIASRVKDSLRGSELRVGSVFYKDRGDTYLSIFNDFDANIKNADDFVQAQDAGGGGDTPEAVDEALEAATRDLKWSENAAARIAFLIMDAPPHNTPEIKAALEASIRKFAERGIRLIPVACSGTDKSTEYLMRSFALLTNGTYLSLTDDSGIGGTHIKPTTDKMAVEFLNDAMVRLIMQFSKTPSCQEQLPVKIVQRDTVKAVLPDTSTVHDPKKQPYAIPVYKIYPNPTAGMVYLDTDGSVGNIYLCDLNGKILSQIAINNRSKMQFDLTDYPAGTYLLRYEYAPDKWLTSKIIRVR